MCTAESQRGRGLASRVLEDAVAHLAATGGALAVLHTGRPHLQQYYGRLGFCSMPMHFWQAPLHTPGTSNDTTGETPDAADDAARAAVTVLSAAGDAPWTLLAAAHTATAARRGWQGFVVRDEAMWTRWIEAECRQPGRALAWCGTEAYMAVRTVENSDGAGEHLEQEAIKHCMMGRH